MVFGLLNRYNLLMAQDGVNSPDNLAVQDSTHLQQGFMTDAVARSSGSGTTGIIIVVAVVIIAAVAYIIIKKKKK